MVHCFLDLESFIRVALATTQGVEKEVDKVRKLLRVHITSDGADLKTNTTAHETNPEVHSAVEDG